MNMHIYDIILDVYNNSVLNTYIGVLNVTFAAVMGNLGKIEPNTTMATSGTDFSTSEVTLQLEDGQTSTTISAPIVNVWKYST